MINRKPYVNRWRPYEVAYVKAMLMSGIKFDVACKKLWMVNKVTGAPYRAEGTIRQKVTGARSEYVKGRSIQIGIARQYHTRQQVADMFNCSLSTVERSYRKYKKEYGNARIS